MYLGIVVLIKGGNLMNLDGVLVGIVCTWVKFL